MMWWPAIVILLVLAGRLWAILPVRVGRGCGWAVMLLAVTAIHVLLGDADPILRMVALCCGLLGGLKAIAYVEWSVAGVKKLPFPRYLGFGFAWFGMDPGAFARTRNKVEWRSHLRIGLTCMVVGTLLALLVRQLGLQPLLLVFIPMSIGFHFGALRVLTAAWRGRGFPVRVLFRNPLGATGLGDFWARRWNLGYSEMMVRVVKRPLERLMPRGAADACVFFLSGLLHELAITLPVETGFGRPTLYFLLNGMAVKVERRTWPQWFRRLWTVGWVVGPVGLLFPEKFHEEVILRCLEILPKFSV